MGKLKRRAKNPRVLSDLVGGDCCTIDMELGPMEVQIGFQIKGAVFVRLRDSRVSQLLSLDGNTPFLELTYEQPSAATRSNEIMEEIDPVLGVGAIDGNELLRIGRDEP